MMGHIFLEKMVEVSLPHSIDVSDNTSSKGKIEKFKWHIKEAQKMMLL